MILLLLVVGVSYIFYRYRSVSNKKFFFQSHFFIALAGSIAILIVSIVFVNTFAPGPKHEGALNSGERVKKMIDSTLALSHGDTSRVFLLAHSPKFHYHQITSIRRESNADYFLGLEASYKRLSTSPVDSISSLGNFGLGMLSWVDKHEDEALEFFHRVKNKQFPGLHFCIAGIMKKYEDAINEYLVELEIKNGMRDLSALQLVRIYEGSKDYEGLYHLYQYDFARLNFSDKLARLTLLHAYDLVAYMEQTAKMIMSKLHWVGFTAASLISLIWLIYIFRLNVYSRSKLIILLGLFIGGAICVPLAFVFYDAVELLTQWDIKGKIISDLLYCIFIIGMSEEFVKILPFLLVLLVVKKFKEPIDYIIYASASALGFAFIENLIYFKEIDSGIIHGRAYFSVIGHMIDSSFIAYGFVISLFKKKDKATLLYLVPAYFLLAASIHGIYDFLLFDHWFIIFFIYFIFIVQLWIVIINNCLNNSESFTYKHARLAERSRVLITLSLTFIFSFEYLATAFLTSADNANLEVVRNAGFAGFIIVFFSSNLSSFDLINDYWRSVSFKEQEKRGYGSRNKRAGIISWYFFNLVQPHNYVGLKVLVYNDPYNKNLLDVLNRKYGGQIFNRIVLYEDDIPDPNWFLIKMSEPLPFATDRPDYILVKLRFQEDSLFEQDEVQVFFKSIVDARLLREQKPNKDSFPFYGWAYMKLDIV